MVWRKHLNKQTVNEYLDTAFIKYGEGKKIISVGSGTADTEFSFLKRNGVEIICIDPYPYSHSYEGSDYTIKIQPKYRYVDDLIKFEPEVVGNCHLLLIWPLPNKSTYDIEALEKLKPLSMVIIYEPTGTSGGSKFLENEWRKDYLEMHSKTVRLMTRHDSFYYTISYFISEKLEKEEIEKIENEKLDNSFSISKLSDPERLKSLKKNGYYS